jgi:hypothetical protein
MLMCFGLKTRGIMKKSSGIDFLSFPVNIDEFDCRYSLLDKAMQWGSTTMNVGTWFGVEDPDIGDNFFVPSDPSIVGNDKVYHSFCTLAEICGHDAQFHE